MIIEYTERLSDEDIAEISDLCAAWRYDKYRHHRLFSQEERSALLRLSLIRDDDPEGGYFLARDGGKLVGFFVLNFLPWDSQHFGMKMYRASVVYDHSCSGERIHHFVTVTVRLLASLYQRFHVSMYVDSDDYGLLNALLSSGFGIFDHRRVYVARRNGFFSSLKPFLKVREFREGDEREIFSLLSGVVFASRFSRDPSLEAGKVNEMYRFWSKELLSSRLDKAPVLVAERAGEIVAFAAGRDVKLDASITKKRLCGESLYYSSKKGVGAYVSVIDWLLGNTRHHYDALEFVVSGGNLAALRVLERAGISPAASQFSLHYHRDV